MTWTLALTTFFAMAPPLAKPNSNGIVLSRGKHGTVDTLIPQCSLENQLNAGSSWLRLRVAKPRALNGSTTIMTTLFQCSKTSSLVPPTMRMVLMTIVMVEPYLLSESSSGLPYRFSLKPNTVSSHPRPPIREAILHVWDTR